MSFKRVLITGAGGMLGSAVYPYFKARYPDVLATDLKWGDLDVRDERTVKNLFSNYRPDLVLHLAALTNLEACELQPLPAITTNARGTELVADAALRWGATLVYISTAGVFDGTKDVYVENDIPRPINVYGATKLSGEHAACQVPAHYVVRAGWMIGGGPRDHKFVRLIKDQMERNVPVIRAVDDKFGTPTYAPDFAANLYTLLGTKKYGTYHMVNSGDCSRYDVACEIAKNMAFKGVVLPVPSSYFEKDFWVPRPRSEQLSNAALARLDLNFMRPWRFALREYLK